MLRSKNSGPFELTFDILFDSEEHYYRVKNSEKINVQVICDLYTISAEQVHHLVFFDQALGVKITISREISSGTAGDRDVYGVSTACPVNEYND